MLFPAHYDSHLVLMSAPKATYLNIGKEPQEVIKPD